MDHACADQVTLRWQGNHVYVYIYIVVYMRIHIYFRHLYATEELDPYRMPSQALLGCPGFL